MNDYEKFYNFLKEEGIELEKIENKENTHVFFMLDHRIDSGANIKIVYCFSKDKENKSVDIDIYNLANLTNPLKKESYLSVLNELNRDCRFGKFVLNESQDISVSHSAVYNGVFDKEASDIIFDISKLMLQSCNIAYPKFMKLQWT